MTDKYRAPQWGDAPANVTKEEWLATAIGALVIGCLVGWALWGRPAQATALLKGGNAAEWLAGVATIIVGIGAWKYARATHAHTLDVAYTSKIEALERRVEKLSLTKFKLQRLKGGKSSIRALEQGVRANHGLVYEAIDWSREDALQVTWEDGEHIAFSAEARGQFAHVNLLRNAFLRLCKTSLRSFKKMSGDPLTNAEVTLIKRFKDRAYALATETDKLVDLIDKEMSRVEHELEETKVKRQDRRVRFDFDP